MKNARAKRAKILFFIVKYANLWGFCCRRRRGCLSFLDIKRNLTPMFVNKYWRQISFDIQICQPPNKSTLCLTNQLGSA